MIDTEGRVDRFLRKYGMIEKQAGEPGKAKSADARKK
jgi:hypothetical protein